MGDTVAEAYAQIQDILAKGDRIQAHKLCKQATAKFKEKDDLNLLEIYLLLIEFELNASDYNSCLKIWKYMAVNRIGIKSPKFYIKWAEFENNAGYTDRAKKILMAANKDLHSPLLDQALVSLESARRPLGEKRIVEKPLQDKSVLELRGREKENFAQRDDSRSFKPRSMRTGKLGPPTRQPKSESLVDPNEKSFPSPESMSSMSPSSKSSSSPAGKRPIQESPLQANPSNTDNVDSSDSDSSFEQLEQSERERTVIDSVNMDLSNTVILSHPTPKAKPIGSSVSYKPPPQTPLNGNQDNMIVVNGKNYTKSLLIGKGGSCKVFKIVDQQGNIFALKKVKLRGQDPSVVEGYKNEIILLNKLRNNDRIIRLYDAQHDAAHQLLLMVLEYGEIDLERMLQKDPDVPLSINFVKNYWEQMLQAVQAIHDQNIIHSDLKPANFLLVGGCLKLIDFGIAKAIPNDTTNIQRDHQSGTVNYMAPEAINYVEISGAKQNYLKQGRASDVWSLACILYRFIYLYPPFGKMPLMVKIHAITNPNHIIPYPETDYPEVVTLLKQCLVFNPKKRLTIPQLLDHPFLKSGQKIISKELIFDILKRAAELGLRESNVNLLADAISKEFI